ncbi:MAG: MFS transporter [Candidatus Nanopelagicales bacterium]|nr:MFS transporter [Candidatus Nanopelagicales bacterium]MDZ4248809.1 MFS transporter [Candidatus Nanopelagicales bacterium]
MEPKPAAQLLRNSGFLRLLTTRLTGSFGDGLLQAGLASFVLFSPERQPTPVAVATSFGILLLPYSLVGPFSGVFLDRWRRRQVLARGNWLRAITVLVTACVVAAVHDGLDLGLIVLVTLGIGRFVLAGLSASLPHVVPRNQLITANSIAPTAGTVAYGIGAVAGVALRGVLGGGDHGSLVVLLVASATYLGAGMIALSMGRDQLGPCGDLPGDSVSAVARGLVDGFRALSRDRPSWRSLTVVIIHRVVFGALTVLLLLILRTQLHAASDPDLALRDFSIVAGTVTAGALVAALVTPAITRRIGVVAWTCLALIAAAIAAPVALAPSSLVAMVIGALVLGLAQQTAKIGADTTIQRHIADDHLGRVFSLYDVAVNVAVVGGALIIALATPVEGVPAPAFLAIGAAYLLTAAWYWRGRSPKSANQQTPTSG